MAESSTTPARGKQGAICVSIVLPTKYPQPCHGQFFCSTLAISAVEGANLFFQIIYSNLEAL